MSVQVDGEGRAKLKGGRPVDECRCRYEVNGRYLHLKIARIWTSLGVTKN